MEARKRWWEDLGMDCLVSVFSKLGLEDLTLGVPFVCKSWHRASLDSQCWKILDFQELDFTSNSKFIAKFKQEYRVQTFSFSAFLKLSLARTHGSAVKLRFPSSLGGPLQEDLILASVKCPKLKELALPTLLWQDDKQLPKLISTWKDLEKLEVKWKPISFLEMLEQIRVSCPNFNGLRLCGFFNSKDAQAMVRCLPKLRRLVMTASFLRKDDLLMILEGCKDLEAVDVSRCRGLDVDHEVLKRVSRIVKIEFEGCKPEESCAVTVYAVWRMHC